MQKYILSYLLLIYLLMPPLSLAQAPNEADTPDLSAQAVQSAPAPIGHDGRFVADQGGDLGHYLFQADRPDGLRFNIPITRYYFNVHRPPEFDINGFLQPESLQTLLEHQILPPTATLRLHVFDVDHQATTCPEVDTLFLNNQPVMLNETTPATLSGINNQWNTLSFQVPISMLKFPQAKGENGQPPPAVNNEIRITIDTQCQNQWGLQVNWATVDIKSPTRPLLFAHGWTGDTTTFNAFERFAQTEHLPTGVQVDLLRGIHPIADTAPILITALKQSSIEFGVDRVNLLAHSKGGLVARYALRTPDTARLVDHLVTFSTPHHGSNLIPDWLNCYFLPEHDQSACHQAADELSIDSIRALMNYRNCERVQTPQPGWVNCQPHYVAQSAIQYFSFVGGLFDVGKKTATLPWLADATPFPHQGKVDAQFSQLTHLNIHTHQISYSCAINYIKSQADTPTNCDSAESITTVDEAQTPIWPSIDAQPIIRLEGLNPTAPLTFTIDQATHLNLNIFATAPFDKLRLTAPNGSDIQPIVQPYQFGWWYQFRDPTPPSGRWQLTWQADDQIAYKVKGLVESQTTLSITTDNSTYHPHESVTVSAILLSEENYIPSATVRLTVTQPDGSIITRPMTARENQYQATFTPTLNGRYHLEVLARHQQTQRYQRQVLQIQPQTAQLEAVEPTLYRNENGLVEGLQVNVSVTVHQPGHFELSGDLVDEQGNPLAHTMYTTRQTDAQLLPVGTHILPLRFVDTALHNPLEPQQFTLQNLVIRDVTHYPVEVDVLQVASTTPVYQANQFTQQAISLINISEAVEDSNQNGLYDTLQIGLRLALAYPGDYQISGRLLDSTGGEITWQHSQFTVETAGLHEATLLFDGATIYQHGLAGPYRLQDLSVFNLTGPGSAVIEDNYTTQAYEVSTFEQAQSENTLTGQVLLPGRTHHAGTVINLKNNGCEEVIAGTTTDITGQFSLPIDIGQTYSCLQASQTYHLTTQLDKLTLPSDIPIITLIAGDVTNDNQIDILDMAYIAARYNQTDTTADLNGDGLVNIFDLSLAGKNYGRQGPVDW